jgi:hypothetical protein
MNQNTTGYSEHIVAFIDVIGFSEAVKKSTINSENYTRVSSLMKKLNEIAQRRSLGALGNEDMPLITVSSFSDSIIISCPVISELAFNNVLLTICEFYITTVTSFGFFLRGALTIGAFHNQDNILYGPALVRAYEIEESLSSWPRCLIDPELISCADIFPDGKWQKHRYIDIGSDGLLYLDYLGFPVANYYSHWLNEIKHQVKGIDSNNSPDIIARKALSDHKSAILNEIELISNNKDRSALFAKFYPLAAYHNNVIDKFAPPISTSELISKLKQMVTDPSIIDANSKQLEAKIRETRNQWQKELIDLNSLIAKAWNIRA